MSRLRVEGLRAGYAERAVLDRVDLDVPHGELHTVLGPSGCGKTTLLRCLAGLKPPAAGRVLLDDEDVTTQAPERRGIVLMHQEDTLFPHLTAARNVAFGLRFTPLERGRRLERAEEWLRLVGLPGAGARRVQELSGGERQRVALARALAVRPRVLLLDEPLSHLDQPLRVSLRGDLRRILREAGATALYVTHDREEAFALGDALLLLDEGRFLDAGPPQRVHDRPASAHAARLLGRRNLFPYRRLDAARLETPLGVLPLALADGAPEEGRLMLREEELRLVPHGPGPEVHVEAAEYLGGRHRFQATLGLARLHVEQVDADGLVPGATAHLDVTRSRPVAWRDAGP